MINILLTGTAGFENKKAVLPIITTYSVWHLFVIRTHKRNELQKDLTVHDVQTLIRYPLPPHKQEACIERDNLKFPITEKIHDEVLSLPISGIQSTETARKIVRFLNEQ